jgi:hypothetical protein
MKAGLDRRWGGSLMSLELTELGPLNECLPLICREPQRGAVRMLGVPDCHTAISKGSRSPVESRGCLFRGRDRLDDSGVEPVPLRGAQARAGDQPGRAASGARFTPAAARQRRPQQGRELIGEHQMPPRDEDLPGPRRRSASLPSSVVLARSACRAPEATNARSL